MAKDKEKGKLSEAEQNLSAVIGDSIPLLDGPTANEPATRARGFQKTND